MAHAVFGHHVRTAPGGEGNRLAGIGRPDPHRPNAGYVIGKETVAWARGSGRDAPEAGIFEPQNLRQSAVAFHVGG